MVVAGGKMLLLAVSYLVIYNSELDYRLWIKKMGGRGILQAFESTSFTKKYF